MGARERRWAHLVLILLILAIGGGLPAMASTDRTAIDEAPPEAGGVAFGVDLNWNRDTLANVSTRLGLTPALSYLSLPYPLDDNASLTLTRAIDAMASVGGGVMVALLPSVTLDQLSTGDAAAFAEIAATAETAGAPLMIDFAPQMNGSWFAYGLKPTQFTPAYRLFVETVRPAAPTAQFVWSPTYPDGYPFVAEDQLPPAGSEDFIQLDTNADGAITMSDDPYAPFYPGDDVVDWVGMAIEHWGNVWPWHENELPEAGKFLAQLRGEYNGLNGDATALPDFYGDYVEQRGKPFALRTAALFLPNEPANDELAIKQAWWRQVISAETLAELPGMKAIIWEEWVRPQAQTNNSIADWRITVNRTVQRAFIADLPMNALTFAPGSFS